MREWLEADGLDADGLPQLALGKPPITLAGLLSEPDLLRNYNGIYNEVELLFHGDADPHAIAGNWQAGDTELALSCLIESLQSRIRTRLAPGHSNLVTDSDSVLGENASSGLPAQALFAGLQMAENLRDQLGRGTNVELALKALLLGLDTPARQGVSV
jgi:hypothetical protein